MQQFRLPALVFPGFCSVFAVCVGLAKAQDPCLSSARLGNIDLSAPPLSIEPQAPDEGGITFVPLETALPGLDAARRAYHGLAAVPLPGPGPADLPSGCADALLAKPVAPFQDAP